MSKHKLLLADDSITIQKVVNLTFADEGVEVVSVGDGNSALDKLRDDAPDIVLADVNMPGLTGYEICARIKERDPKDQIPVVLLVGSFEPFDEEEAERVGADGYLTKPFKSISQLVDKVAELLGTANEEASDASNASVAGAVFGEPGFGGFSQSIESTSEPSESSSGPFYPDMEEPEVPPPSQDFGNSDDDFEMSEAFGSDDSEIIEATDDIDGDIEEIHQDFNKTQPLTESDIKEMAVSTTESEPDDSASMWSSEVGSAEEDTDEVGSDPNDEIRYLQDDLTEDDSFAEEWTIEDSDDVVDFEVTSDEIENELASFSETSDQQLENGFEMIGESSDHSEIEESETFEATEETADQPEIEGSETFEMIEESSESAEEFEPEETYEFSAQDETGVGVFDLGGAVDSDERSDTSFNYDDSPSAFDSFGDENDDDDVKEESVESFVAADFPMPEGASVLNLDELNLLELPPVEKNSDLEVENPGVESAEVSGGSVLEKRTEVEPETDVKEVEASRAEVEESSFNAAIQDDTGTDRDTATAREAVNEALSKEMVEAITQRVIETLSEKAIREIAWEVVPDMANLIIKKMAEDEMND